MRSTGRISIAAAIVFALVIVGSTASAAPQGPWVQPAADVSVSGLIISDPQITTAPDGTATAVWDRYNGANYTIQAANRPPGGSFGAPVDLSVTGGSAFSPQISTAPDGTATAVWHRYDGSNNIIQAATRPPGGSFGAPVNLSATGQPANFPQISTAPDGTATVVWSSTVGGKNIIRAATRAPGGSFGVPVDLSGTGELAGEQQITTAPDGTTTAIWRRNSIIQASTRPPDGAFGAPVDLSAIGESANGPQIAAAPDGTATAVWFGPVGSDFVIQAVTRPPGGAFGTPVDISAAGQDAYFPKIATAPDGTATAVWYRNDGSNDIIQAATRPPGGSFGATVDLSANGQSASQPQITTAPDGTATAVWRRDNGSNDIIQAATRPPAGSFGAPVDLSATGEDAFDPQGTTAPDGTVTAIWSRFIGGNLVVQSISTARPSFTLGVAKTGSGTVTSSPVGIDCGADCSGTFVSFTKVVMTATPDSDSKFTGWGGACEETTGNTCERTLLEDENVTANFKAKKAKLKIPKVKPTNPKVKRGKKVKIKVTAKNAGDATAKSAKLCLKLSKGVKKKLKPNGKTCQKLGSLGAGKAKIKPFGLKATGKAKKGKKYKVTFKLTAKGAKAVSKAVKVNVR